MNRSKRTIIVSNRLPYTVSAKGRQLEYKKSEGGLATCMDSLYKEGNNVWLGWPGNVVSEEHKPEVTTFFREENLEPLFLTQKEIDSFYKGFSNETLWPLYHSFPSYANYDRAHWQCYVDVNRKYAEAIIRMAGAKDRIWIHDYQLMLVPELVRMAMPDAEIGFFQHIPFPSQELFRLLPWRKEILLGILGADLIGFHTYDDVRHFLSAVSRITKLETSSHEIHKDGRLIVTDAFPVSIDYNKYAELAASKQTARSEVKIREKAGPDVKLMISIDRLDYSKGIIHRLKAYRLFLEQHPEFIEKVTYIHLVVPSRDSVTKYRELKEEMNTLISEINGTYATLYWQPIQYFYRSFPPYLLSALYKTADVALVTPMRDGMNLVSKEYVASQLDKQGVLMLSETAGASIELPEAITINPNDIWTFADKIHEALTMPALDKAHRMAQMQQTVATFDVHTWLKNFMTKLEEVKEKQNTSQTKVITESLHQDIILSYKNSKRRLLLLDYDGTLVPFKQHAQEATPDDDIIDLLNKLSSDPRNKVLIISGRDHETLDEWLGALNVDMVAEHGIWHKNGKKKWQQVKGLNNGWQKDIYHIMSLYTERTPGTYIEQKSHSLAWHYRKVEPGLGTLRVQQLINDLNHFTHGNNLQILQGDKVVEVKSSAINKGTASARWLEANDYDFILAIGDDTTDEDVFKAMPDDAITIKVGNKLSAARYYLHHHISVRNLLREMHAGSMSGTEDELSTYGDAVLR